MDAPTAARDREPVSPGPLECLMIALAVLALLLLAYGS